MEYLSGRSYEFLTNDQQSVIHDLYSVGGIDFQPRRVALHTTYPDAPLLPMYVDLRTLGRSATLLEYTSRLYETPVKNLIRKSNGHIVLSPIPTAALPIGTLLFQRFRTKLLPPRMQQKNHGKKAEVDGMIDYDRGSKAIIIDDVATTGGSILRAAQILRSAGLEVEHAVVLMDYQFNAAKMLEQHGIALHSRLSAKQVIGYLHQIRYVSSEEYEKVLRSLEELADYLSSVDGS